MNQKKKVIKRLQLFIKSLILFRVYFMRVSMCVCVCKSTYFFTTLIFVVSNAIEKKGERKISSN
jgi:hypothetical protein